MSVPPQRPEADEPRGSAQDPDGAGPQSAPASVAVPRALDADRTGPADILDTPMAGPAAIRGGGLRIIGYIVGVALSVGSAALLLRYLGPVSFGRYATVVALITLVGGITEAGMTNIGIREYSMRSTHERTRLLQDLLGIRIVLTLLGVAAAMVFMLLAGYDDVLVLGGAIAGGGLLLQVVQVTYSVPLHSQLRLGWVALLEFSRQAATVAAIVVLVLAGASLISFFAVAVIASLVALAATVPVVRSAVRLTPSFDLAAWRELLRVTLPYALATAAGLLYMYLALILMSLISTEVQTGFFAASFRIFLVVVAVPSLIVTAAFPILARAARDDRTRLAYAMRRLSETSLVLGAGAALVLGVGAPVAIDVMGGAGYEPAVDVLRIQSIAVFTTFLVATWGFGLLSLGRYRDTLIVNLPALVITGALTLVLAPRLGATGAAIATVCADAALALCAAVLLTRADSSLAPPLRPFAKVGLAVLAGVGVALIPGPPALASMLLAGLAYAAVALATGAVPTEIREAAAGIVRGRRRPSGPA